MTTFAEPKITPSKPTHSSPAPAAITPELLASFRRDFQSKSGYALAQNAVTQVMVDDVALNRSVITNTDHTFSHLLDDWACTNQKKSGRCWCFAGLNLFRAGALKKMNLKEFEFSQNYTLFWDKFERANYFLEAIIETADRPVDDRTVAFLLDKPLEDGGQWNMFVNIVKKHGLAPKSAMPESQSSSDTQRMNSILLHKLRDGAKTLRDLRGHSAPMEALRAAKLDILKVIHRILCIHLGTPPAKFDWQWNDKDKAFHRDGEMTPQEFANKYVELKLDEYVCLVNDPRKSSPVNRTFTVDYLGNVVGGDRVIYLNVEIGLMKEIAKRTIMEGEPVWFGCDVGKMMRRDLGVWDKKLFDFDTLYDTEFNLTKADRLVYHQTLMTHAMVFTGVDVVSDPTERARRWRVENSWGEENSGRKGFYVMNDSWFDEYMFEIAAKKAHLPPELLTALDQEPIVLPAWDPMGALAV
ncbi:MAG: C1 family peptidase [Phycisphaerales bacterium]|nr:C1 family peptidase [Phycisphaerales bacterium]MCI0630739.1 C1 family peptidase [Phycisphaerales bacterium]MCI0676569.1 C1 family peptidase [Phycisphaerales bacterium]